MSVSLEFLAGNPDAVSGKPECVVRSVVEGFIRERGPKRGLDHAAALLGVTTRWARAVRYGEGARVNAETFLRAVEAHRALRAERRARVLRELAEIEGGADAHRVLEADDQARDLARGSVGGAGEAMGGPHPPRLRAEGPLT
jgi:hypothetical protein